MLHGCEPLIAIVAGEPAGVGPELAVRIAAENPAARMIAIADPLTLRAAADALGMDAPITVLDSVAGYRDGGTGLQVLPVTQQRPTVFGTLDPANAPSVIDALNLASDLALSGAVDGIVTGPTHKAHLIHAGFPYSGTTEWLADRAGRRVVMMLAHDRLRVALVTTHLPLRAVADAVTADALHECLTVTHEALRNDFGIAQPRIAVLGLNPHAGESGELGREEIEVYAPVMDALRGAGMNLLGPLPADTAFLPDKLRDYDAVVAAYHDQGLPVLKYSGFEEAVNLTLGLPYPRVAVDHGTALDLAGTGMADASSMRMAVKMCAEIARRRRDALNGRQ